MTTWSTYLDEHQDQFQHELLEFLRIPSISSLPDHAADVQAAGEWVAARMQTAGIEGIQILPTAGHPVVYGEWLHAEGKPTVMIYGHFDVQPVDPLTLWTHPPFEPFVEDGRVYARGASDDKGNMLVPILAVEALLKSEGTLPINLKFFFEGQEEIGSPSIPPFVAEHRDLFACDLVVSADGGQWSETEPVILLSLRGGCGVQIDVQGAATDLHSGMYGGAVQNPIHALVSILDSMRGPDGHILVDGFYDDVLPLSEDDRARIAAVPYDDAEYKQQINVDELFGEAGYTTNERTWGRPTLEINGIWGGFQGEGTKTVLPNLAHAKITCRLVANQNPAHIADLLVAHVAQHAPAGVHVTTTKLPFTAQPYLIPAEHPANQAARDVLVEIYGREPYYIRSGGSIPVCSLFLSNLGAYTISFGFGMEDEQVHAPNEFYRLSSFVRGQGAYCKLLHRLVQGL